MAADKDKSEGLVAVKILLVYCNLYQEPLVPLGVSMLVATLKQAGHKVKIFDTTFYSDKNSDQNDRVASGQVSPYSDTVFPVYNRADMAKDFCRVVDNAKPDVVGFSCTENTYNVALELAQWCRGVKTIIGGPFATFYRGRWPKVFDEVCRGEGERFPLTATQVIFGPDGCANLDSLPPPDFSEWDPHRYIRPMAGKMYRMFPVEIGRGCPYVCTYCSAPAYEMQFKKWRRIKTVGAVMRDIENLNGLEPEYLYLVSETFLAMPSNWRREFYDRYYEECRLPFWMNTRPERINAKDLYELKRCGCHRISLGVEHGNAIFRAKMLKRHYSNRQVLHACKLIKDAGIQLSVNNMVGFPDETEALAENTIELNRQIDADSHTISIYQPYWGTALRDYCVAKKYIPPDFICAGHKFGESVLDMPQLKKAVIEEHYYKGFNELVMRGG